VFYGTTAFPVWGNLYIENQTSQGIFYNIYGNKNNRTVVFEYYVTRYGPVKQYCHFQVLFFQAKPGIVQFIYLDVSDGGKSAIVGVQGKTYISINVLIFNIIHLQSSFEKWSIYEVFFSRTLLCAAKHVYYIRHQSK
jgi:hypothetical protein